MIIAACALSHFTEIGHLLEDMAPLGIGLYQHEYDALAFGSFVVVLGTDHQRVRFSWDGKESVLAIAMADVQNTSSTCNWVQDAHVSLPNGEGLFAEIASEACSMLKGGDYAV